MNSSWTAHEPSMTATHECDEGFKDNHCYSDYFLQKCTWTVLEHFKSSWGTVLV